MPPMDDAARDRIARLERQHDTQQQMIHTVDKKVDVMAEGVNTLNNTVVKLNTTIEKHAEEGKLRHKKADFWTKLSPVITLAGMASLLMALETGSLKPLLTLIATIGGIKP